MFQYSVYDNKRSLDELIAFSDSVKTCYLETGNILLTENELITWNQLEDIRNKLIDKQKIILVMETEKPFYDLNYHKELLKRIMFLGVKYIKPLIDNTLIEPIECVDQLVELCKVARSYGIGVLTENNAGYEKTDKYFEDMYKNVSGEKPQFILNPLEYVKNKKHPFFHAFYTSRLKNDIIVLRINDGLFVSGEPVLPGDGNAEIKEMVSILLARSFNGWFSIGPYMEGADIHKKLLDRFKNLLKNM